MYLHTNSELSRDRLSEVRVLERDEHKDRCDCKHYHATFAAGSSLVNAYFTRSLEIVHIWGHFVI